MTRHWSEDPYWTEAADRLYELREEGTKQLVIDLDAIDETLYDGDGPAYRALEAMLSVHEHEGMDGFRGLHELSWHCCRYSASKTVTLRNKLHAQTHLSAENEAMPGLVKIGLATDTVESRISNLSSSTGVPLPFDIGTQA